MGNNTINQWMNAVDAPPANTPTRYLTLCFDDVTKQLYYQLLWYERGTWCNRLYTEDWKVKYWIPLPQMPKNGDSSVYFIS